MPWSSRIAPGGAADGRSLRSPPANIVLDAAGTEHGERSAYVVEPLGLGQRQVQAGHRQPGARLRTTAAATPRSGQPSR